MRIALPVDTLIVYAGDFGRQVVSMLDTSGCVVQEAEGPVFPATLPYASRVVAVWAGYQPENRDWIDEVSFDRGIPSVGVELLPHSLVCGPVVVPGFTACYDCFSRRMLQHAESSVTVYRASVGLAEAYSSAEVAIACGFIGQAMSDIENVAETADIGGAVRVFDLPNGNVSRWSTVAVDRCRRCGSRFTEHRHPTSAIQAAVKG